MKYRFDVGTTWPAAPLGPNPYISADLDGDQFTLIVGIELRHTSEKLRKALEKHRFTFGFTIDPPRITLIISDEYFLWQQTMSDDITQRQRIARQVSLAKTRHIVIIIVRDGVIVSIIEKQSKAIFWRLFGRLMRAPKQDEGLEAGAAGFIWPISCDVRPVYEIDGNWRYVGWRPKRSSGRSSAIGPSRPPTPPGGN